MRSVLLSCLRFGIGVALLFYLLKSGAFDVETIPRLMAAWPITIAAVIVLFLDLALMACRLCVLLSAASIHLSFRSSLWLTAVGAFFSMFLPGRTGGDVARIFYTAKDNHGRRTEIVSILLFDRAMGLFSLLVLPVLFAPLFPDLLHNEVIRYILTGSALLAGGMLAGFLLCLFIPADYARRIAVLSRVASTLREFRRRPYRLLAAVGIAFADNLMVVAVTALAVFVVDPASLNPRLCLIVPIGEIANSLPLTPGGLGVGEAAFSALFKIAGLAGGANALLCWRIWNALAAIPGFIVYLRGRRQLALSAQS